MRTLAKPPKTKKIEKEQQKQGQKKAPSKKITKTVFQSPFTYKISTLSHQDMDELRNHFLPYLKQLRQTMPVKPKTNAHQKFISFNATQTTPTALTSPEIIIGVKSCIKALKDQSQKIELMVVFYEEKYLYVLIKSTINVGRIILQVDKIKSANDCGEKRSGCQLEFSDENCDMYWVEKPLNQSQIVKAIHEMQYRDSLADIKEMDTSSQLLKNANF